MLQRYRTDLDFWMPSKTPKNKGKGRNKKARSKWWNKR